MVKLDIVEERGKLLWMAEIKVWKYEENRLRKLKKSNLISQRKWISKIDCAAGYDIESFNEHGEVIYIEVKDTAGGAPSFELTVNEYEKAKAEGDHYYIYHIKNVLIINQQKGME